MNECLKFWVLLFSVLVIAGSFISVMQASAADLSIEDRALSCLSNVFQLNLNAYNVVLKQTNQIAASDVNGEPRTHLVYSLDSETSGLFVELVFCGEKLEVCTIMPKTGVAKYSQTQPNSVLASAKAFVGHLRQFSDLEHFRTVDSMLNSIQTLKTGVDSRTDGNVVLKTIVDGNLTTFIWAQKIDGVESSSSKVTVMFSGRDLIFFQDAWGLSSESINYSTQSSGELLSTASAIIPRGSVLPQKAESILSNVIGIDDQKQKLNVNLKSYQASPFMDMIFTFKNYQGSLKAAMPREEQLLYNIRSSQGNIDMLYTFVDGNLNRIHVLEHEGSFAIDKTANSDVARAGDFLDNYKTYTGKALYGELKSMLADGGGEAVNKTSGNLKLEVSAQEGSSTFRWTYTHDGIEAPEKCVAIRYIDGFLKYFIDNWNIYKIGSVDFNLSEQEAIDIALAQARNFSRTLDNGTSILLGYNVTAAMIYQNKFAPSLSVDEDKAHSNDLLELYPMRHVWVSFDKFYPGNVYGIEVYIWADTKQVCHIQERSSPSDPPADMIADYNVTTVETQDIQPSIDVTPKSSSLLIMRNMLLEVAVIFLIIILPALLLKKKVTCLGLLKPRFSKFIGLLLCLLTSSTLLFSVVSTVNATVTVAPYGRALIFGSESKGAWREDLQESTRKQNVEVNYQKTVAKYIASYFADNGYSAGNYTGGLGSDKWHILSYISDEQYYPRMVVVDFDHGNGNTDTKISSETPDTEFHYMFEDNNGTIDREGFHPEYGVFDSNIYDVTTGKIALAFINTCNSAHVNDTGTYWGYYDDIDQGLVDGERARGMPFAFTHKLVGANSTSQPDGYMSGNGYRYPDNNPNCYIGFLGGSASLSQNVNGSGFPYIFWVASFFYNSLSDDDLSIHDALDEASYNSYFCDFDESPLGREVGFDAVWPMYYEGSWHSGENETGTGWLKVYGNSNIHLHQPTLSLNAKDTRGNNLANPWFFIDGTLGKGPGSSLEMTPGAHTIDLISTPYGYSFAYYYVVHDSVGEYVYSNPLTLQFTSDTTVTAVLKPGSYSYQPTIDWPNLLFTNGSYRQPTRVYANTTYTLNVTSIAPDSGELDYAIWETWPNVYTVFDVPSGVTALANLTWSQVGQHTEFAVAHDGQAQSDTASLNLYSLWCGDLRGSNGAVDFIDTVAYVDAYIAFQDGGIYDELSLLADFNHDFYVNFTDQVAYMDAYIYYTDHN